MFFNPPAFASNGGFSQNLVFNLNEEIPIAWMTNSSSYFFQMYQQNLSNSSQPHIGSEMFSGITCGAVASSDAKQDPNSLQMFNWTVSVYQLDLTESPVFYIQASDLNSRKHIFRTQAFNITNAANGVESAPTTSSSALPSSSTSTSTPTPSSTFSSSTTVLASPTQPPATTRPTASLLAAAGVDSHISVSAQVGIGFAVAIISILLMLCAWLIGRRLDAKEADGSCDLCNEFGAVEMYTGPENKPNPPLRKAASSWGFSPPRTHILPSSHSLPPYSPGEAPDAAPDGDSYSVAESGRETRWRFPPVALSQYFVRPWPSLRSSRSTRSTNSNAITSTTSGPGSVSPTVLLGYYEMGSGRSPASPPALPPAKPYIPPYVPDY